jgi:hypothetical protein
MTNCKFFFWGGGAVWTKFSVLLPTVSVFACRDCRKLQESCQNEQLSAGYLFWNVLIEFGTAARFCYFLSAYNAKFCSVKTSLEN